MMSNINNLFHEELKILNMGTSTFKDELEMQNQKVTHLDWSPPASGDVRMMRIIDRLNRDEEIKAANEKVVEIMKNSHPILVDVDKAINVIPGMTPNMILHAGPPVKWPDMAGPMKGAIIGALIYEGRADSEESAVKLAESGEIAFEPCHAHGAVGPMAGIISPSMPVHVIFNKTYGNHSYATVNEGLGKVLRYGAFSEEVISRLKWIETDFAPVLKKALSLTEEGIDLKAIISQAVHMGDECHNRNKASTSLFFREIALYIVKTGYEPEQVEKVLRFMKENDHYFLNLSMPSCKAAVDAAQGVEKSTIITTMARNGVEFGIKVSGMGKDQWFTGPANMVKGLMFPGFTEDDAAPDIGDSAIAETMGLGGFIMGAAPAIVQFVGGTVKDAIGYSEQMYAITAGENGNYSIPNLDFRGSAIGIDLLKVIEKGVLPIINTGMAHKVAGVGQVGAGLVHPPMECFEKALEAYSGQEREDPIESGQER